MILALMLEDRAEAVLHAQILLGPNPRHGYKSCPLVALVYIHCLSLVSPTSLLA
jgi:hypothetical protein